MLALDRRRLPRSGSCDGQRHGRQLRHFGATSWTACSVNEPSAHFSFGCSPAVPAGSRACRTLAGRSSAAIAVGHFSQVSVKSAYSVSDCSDYRRADSHRDQSSGDTAGSRTCRIRACSATRSYSGSSRQNGTTCPSPLRRAVFLRVAEIEPRTAVRLETLDLAHTISIASP